MNTMEKQA
jgi:calcium/calmodulin-dependent protein kinase I